MKELGTRNEYLIEQKEKKARKLFGVFPAQYPKEILWAMNVLPVEIWDPPLTITHANEHLQPYICSVVSLGLELIMQGKCEALDGFLFPHTCDSIQNLASIVYDYLGMEKPCYFFYHPKASSRDSSRAFYQEQLTGLISRLEEQLGPLDKSELEKRVHQGQQIARVLRELYDLRARGELDASNAEFYKVIRSGEYLHPDDFLPLLEEFLSSAKGGGSSGKAVVLSGILPNPLEILALLDELGVRIAHDDLLCCGRRLPAPTGSTHDPLEALTDSYFAMPPCTTKNSPVHARINELLSKIEQTNARGVIFYIVKFCEPELFDVPQVSGELKRRGLATLVIDCEVNQILSGQVATRVEAFAEMIS
jgi:benzoyl-CoA reductase/2-hydroxyglutaryl-CoA dehydratase subunit BcrC/BadD/HgdB